MIKRRLVCLLCKAGCLLCLLGCMMFYGSAAEGLGLGWIEAAGLCTACLLLCKVFYRMAKVARLSRVKCGMIKLPEK